MNLDREQSLVEEALSDPRAFERLYDHYFPRLYAYVAYRVGGKQDAEDLVEDIFVKAIEGLSRGRFRWEREGSFASWLFRIAHNAVSDHYRGAKPGESIPLDLLPGLQSSALLPDDALLRKEEFALLRQLLDTLSPRRQEIITLKFFGGLHNNQIAQVLGLDERTVASHLCRGLEDLHRKYLQERASHQEKPR